jgi:hypothetical protein
MTFAMTLFALEDFHSENAIPEILDQLRPQYPAVQLRDA